MQGQSGRRGKKISLGEAKEKAEDCLYDMSQLLRLKEQKDGEIICTPLLKIDRSHRFPRWFAGAEGPSRGACSLCLYFEHGKDLYILLHYQAYF